MEPEERERLCKLASDGVRRAARDGSKLEQYLLVNLKACGYKADFHKEYLISAEQMHVDIFLPHLKVAIEVDGPTHFLPIWGEEHLEKRIEEDNRKTGLLLQSGYVVIRIKHMVKTLSDRMKRETFERLRHELEQISEAFPANERVIELEVK
jgi:very-short-patch-repair endonuclease